MAITWLCFQPSVSLGLLAFCHIGRHHQGSWESREWLHARFGSSSRPLFIHGSFLMSSKVPFLLGLRMRNFLSSFSHFLDMWKGIWSIPLSTDSCSSLKAGVHQKVRGLQTSVYRMILRFHTSTVGLSYLDLEDFQGSLKGDSQWRYLVCWQRWM